MRKNRIAKFLIGTIDLPPIIVPESKLDSGYPSGRGSPLVQVVDSPTRWCRAFELAVEIGSPPFLVETLEYLVNILVAADELELAYELARFVAEHPTSLGKVRENVEAVMAQLDPHLPEAVRQAAIERAQSRDLDAYCDLLRSQCGTWQG